MTATSKVSGAPVSSGVAVEKKVEKTPAQLKAEKLFGSAEKMSLPSTTENVDKAWKEKITDKAWYNLPGRLGYGISYFVKYGIFNSGDFATAAKKDKEAVEAAEKAKKENTNDSVESAGKLREAGRTLTEAVKNMPAPGRKGFSVQLTEQRSKELEKFQKDLEKAQDMFAEAFSARCNAMKVSVGTTEYTEMLAAAVGEVTEMFDGKTNAKDAVKKFTTAVYENAIATMSAELPVDEKEYKEIREKLVTQFSSDDLKTSTIKEDFRKALKKAHADEIKTLAKEYGEAASDTYADLHEKLLDVINDGADDVNESYESLRGPTGWDGEIHEAFTALEKQKLEVVKKSAAVATLNTEQSGLTGVELSRWLKRKNTSIEKAQAALDTAVTEQKALERQLEALKTQFQEASDTRNTTENLNVNSTDYNARVATVAAERKAFFKKLKA